MSLVYWERQQRVKCERVSVGEREQISLVRVKEE